MAKNYQYGNNGATPLQNELREDLLDTGQYQQANGINPNTQPQPQQVSYQEADTGAGNSKKRKGFLIFGITCLIAAVISMGAFAGTTSVTTSPAAADALQKGVSTTLPVGVRLASGDDNVSAEPTDYTVTGSTDSPTTKLYVWDYAGEDGDYVQVLVDGSPVTEEFMIKHQPREIEVPSAGVVQVKGIHDAGGGLTYAVHYDLNGESYFNNAPEGVLNTYTLTAG